MNVSLRISVERTDNVSTYQDSSNVCVTRVIGNQEDSVSVSDLNIIVTMYILSLDLDPYVGVVGIIKFNALRLRFVSQVVRISPSWVSLTYLFHHYE